MSRVGQPKLIKVGTIGYLLVIPQVMHMKLIMAALVLQLALNTSAHLWVQVFRHVFAISHLPYKQTWIRHDWVSTLINVDHSQ